MSIFFKVNPAFLFAFLAGATTLAGSQVPFFSDQSTLLSFPALHLLESNFRSFLLPEALDTGHPPLSALYLAVWWKLWGVSLTVTHLALFPVIAGAAYYFFRICREFLDDKGLLIALSLYLLQPTILAHSVSPGTEPFLWLFALGSWWYMYRQQWTGMTIMSALLLLTNLRGLVLLGAIGLCELAIYRPISLANLLRMSFRYMLVLLPFLLWNVYHWRATGWALSHDASPWVEHRALVGPDKLLLGGAVFGLRLLEFGMLPVWLMAIWNAAKAVKARQLTPLHWWWILLLGLLLLALLPFANPITNRYLLLLQMVTLVLAARELVAVRFRNVIWAITLTWMTASHFFVCSDIWSKRIGYAHDATLVHLFYSTQLRPDIHHQLNLGETDASRPVIWSGFPEYHSFFWTNLETDQLQSTQIDTQHIERADYILLSNIMNEIPYGTSERIKNNWTPVYTSSSGPLWLHMYRNPAMVNNR